MAAELPTPETAPPTQVGRVHKGSRDEEGGHHSEP